MPRMTLPSRSSALRKGAERAPHTGASPAHEGVSAIPLFPRTAEMSGPSDGPSYGQPTEAALMGRVSAGDVRAFEQIVERHWRRVFLYAKHMLEYPDRANDIAQEAFARLWQHRERWESTGSVRVWLLRTARNLAISEQRKRKVQRRWASSAEALEIRRPSTPLQEVEHSELREAIRAAVQGLSPRRREVFTLFHLQNLSYREISEIIGIRPQTAANHLQAALGDLRAALRCFYPELAARDSVSSPPPEDSGARDQ